MIEEIVSREDLPSVRPLVETVTRMNALFEERPITVRLIPGEPSTALRPIDFLNVINIAESVVHSA